jgi:putative cell wall-binding protein
VVGRSADRGATWTRTGVAGIRGYVFEGPAQTPFTANQAFTNSTFPRLAADQRSGAVYLVYNNGGRPTAPGEFRAADHFIHPDSDVWFQRSGNGRDWSGATQLNDVAPLTSGVSQTRHPNVAVAPGGRVDVVWQDRRHWHRGCVHTHNPCLEARLGDTYYTWSEDRGRSFAPDRRITDRSMNNDVGYDYRFGTYWTYAPALAHLDRDRLLVGWMDSRLGDVDDDNQDIYLARIDHGAASRVPEHTISAAGASRLAVTLSRRAYPGGPEAVLGGTFATRPWTRVVVVHERDAAAVLAAGVLARANIAPVLLSGRTGMDAATRAELVRMAPIGAFVVGSRAALSDHVVEQLAASGIAPDQIVRIEGTSRADTVRRIALASDRRSVAQRQAGEQAFDAAVLVNPADEDGYATAILAAARRLPVLLAGRGAVPAATRQAITELAVAKVLVAGDRESISDAAVAGLPGVQRLGGSSAVRTSRVVLAEARRRAVPYNTVFATTGRMEAALLGATGARIGGQLLFADRDDALDAVRGLRLGGTVDRILHVRSGRGE